MKGKLAWLVFWTALSGTALAQAPAQPGSTGQSGTASQQPAQAQTAPAPVGKHEPVAKTQEEYKAYQEAVGKPDGPSAEAAADAFAKQFPQSELRAPLFQHVMSLYQNANNSDKVLEWGRKTLDVEPDNGPALVTVATVLSTRTQETDLDRDERLAEAKKYATRAIELANAGQAVPAGTPAAQAGPYRDTILSMAYAALGSVEFDYKNYAAAEQDLRKSVSPSLAEPDPVTWYQLALTLQRENKNADALTATQKCVEVAKDSPQVASVCKNLETYLEKVVSNPPAKPANNSSAPPSQVPVQPK
jgi:tetratricopeptide (TPR) repeat protein